jgi:hypothetical protein
VTARRTYEILGINGGRVIAFRTVDTDEAWAPHAALVMLPPNDAEYPLTGEDVEALHAMTYEILAGRATDPRLIRDAHILCGFQWYSAARNGQAYCCLGDGHTGGGDAWQHITHDGEVFAEVPF